MEYAFETARMRIFLPSQGDTWFFIDDKMTMKEFKEECLAEDPKVRSVKFIDTNNKVA